MPAASGPSGAAILGVVCLGLRVLSSTPGTSRWERKCLAFERCMVFSKLLQNLE